MLQLSLFLPGLLFVVAAFLHQIIQTVGYLRAPGFHRPNVLNDGRRNKLATAVQYEKAATGTKRIVAPFRIDERVAERYTRCCSRNRFRR